MLFRCLDVDHDWCFGKGNQSYLREEKAIAMNIKTRLLSFLNDCFFDQKMGIDWIRLQSNLSTKEEIILTCRGVILKSYGVTKVNKIIPDISNRKLNIEYNIDTIYSRQFSDILEVN